MTACTRWPYQSASASKSVASPRKDSQMTFSPARVSRNWTTGPASAVIVTFGKRPEFPPPTELGTRRLDQDRTSISAGTSAGAGGPGGARAPRRAEQEAVASVACRCGIPWWLSAPTSTRCRTLRYCFVKVSTRPCWASKKEKCVGDALYSPLTVPVPPQMALNVSMVLDDNV